MDGFRNNPAARRPAAGGILLELLLSIGLFAVAAAFTLSAMRTAVDGIGRVERRARAFDLAASRLAELDAGLVAAGDLGEAGDPVDGLVVSIEIVPDAVGGLARARATVREAPASNAGEPTIVATHERLVDLRDRGGSGR
jgi:hypothetical protein